MNDLIKYHDNDQVIEQSVVSFESPPESYGENTSNLLQGILRRWPIVFLVFILICAVGIPAIWFLVEPLYTVTGAIRVVPIIENIVTGENESGTWFKSESYTYSVENCRIGITALNERWDSYLDLYGDYTPCYNLIFEPDVSPDYTYHYSFIDNGCSGDPRDQVAGGNADIGAGTRRPPLLDG